MRLIQVPSRLRGMLPALLIAAICAMALGRPAGSTAAGRSDDLAQYEEKQGEAVRPSDLDARKSASRFRYLMLGYGFIWVSLGVYLININRGVGKVGKEIEELKARLEETAGTAGGRTR